MALKRSRLQYIKRHVMFVWFGPSQAPVQARTEYYVVDFRPPKRRKVPHLANRIIVATGHLWTIFKNHQLLILFLRLKGKMAEKSRGRSVIIIGIGPYQSWQSERLNMQGLAPAE